MNGKFMRRIGKAAAVLAGASLLLTGCGGGTPATPPTGSPTAAPTGADAEPVTITFGWWGGDARAEQTQQVIEAFQTKYPHITVEPQYTDWNGYWDQLATLTAAGDAPDVSQMDELYLASYGQRGALLDLDTVSIDTSSHSPEALATGQLSGTQYAIPHSVTTFAIVANTDLFEKYGVAMPDDETWSWDDYAALAKELTDKSNGEINGSTQIGGFDMGNIKHWAHSADNYIFDEEGNVSLDPQVLADLWQFQLDMIDSGAMQSAPAIVESFNAGISAGALATGKVALGAQWNTQITALTDASGATLELLKLPEPEGKNPASLKPGMYWAISSKSEHPAEAALLVDFLINSQEAADIIKTERGIPANEAIRASIAGSLSDTDAKAVAFLDRVEMGATPVVTPNGASGIEGMLQRYTQEVFAGQKQPLPAAEEFVKELQGEIDAAK